MESDKPDKDGEPGFEDEQTSIDSRSLAKPAADVETVDRRTVLGRPAVVLADLAGPRIDSSAEMATEIRETVPEPEMATEETPLEPVTTPMLKAGERPATAASFRDAATLVGGTPVPAQPTFDDAATSVMTGPPEGVPAHQKSSGKGWIVVVLLLLLAAGGGGFAFSKIRAKRRAAAAMAGATAPAKSETKPAPKVEAKPEAKVAPTPPAVEPTKDHVAPTPPEEAKAAPPPEPKAEAKPEPKAEAKPEPKAEAKPEPKPAVKEEPKASATSAPTSEAKAPAIAEPKAPAPKREPKAVVRETTVVHAAKPVGEKKPAETKQAGKKKGATPTAPTAPERMGIRPD